VVISGSGTLALESARSPARRGYEVTHLCASADLGPSAGRGGFRFWCCKKNGARASTSPQGKKSPGARPGCQVTAVRTTRGRQLLASPLIAVGIEPALDYLRGSGVSLGRGVRVDGLMRTRSPMSTRRANLIETSSRSAGRVRVLGSGIRPFNRPAWRRCTMAGALSAPPPEVGAPFYNATFLMGLPFVSLA